MVPYNYIRECAGHLLLARRSVFENLNFSEIQYRRNAYVTKYCAMKLQGVSKPSSS